MIGKCWLSATGLIRRPPRSLIRYTVIVTTQCRDRIAEQLSDCISRGHEGIVYFVGLTSGVTTLALLGVAPRAETTPGSIDVPSTEIGKVVRIAAEWDLQVVGQLHTHPRNAYHSPGDLTGMRIRHPGYFSIVIPDYGSQLPSFKGAHTLFWTPKGYQEVDLPIKFIDGQAYE